MSEPLERTPLSHLLAQIPSSTAMDQDIPVTIADDWLQGRAIYGGLSAALCLQAVRAAQPELPPLRSAQLSFLSPAGPGVVLRASLLRQGKSMTFASADMQRDDGALAARGMFCFGAARDSRLAFGDLAPPSVCRPEEAGPFFEDANGNNRGPNFAQHFESRRAAGVLPMSGAERPAFTAWMRHRDTAIDSVAVALAALGDALPPAAMACFESPAPVSSVTWQFDLLMPVATTRDGWWLCRSHGEHIGDGYATQAMTIWNTQGQPVMVGRQNVAVFY